MWRLLLVVLWGVEAWALPMRPPLEYSRNMESNQRFSSFEPYVSHVDFIRMADHQIDLDTPSFDPDLVEQGDIIYVHPWFIEWFSQKVHDQIRAPYILITNQDGDGLPKPGWADNLLYDSKCAAWFCGRLLFSHHPKLFPLPFGQNVWIAGEKGAWIREVQEERPFVKKHLLYMNHLPRPAGDRLTLIDLFADLPYCYSHNKRGEGLGIFLFHSYPEYLRDLASSHFVVSPIGLETDCIRTWEAFLFDCIPIVEHTYLDSLYEGLPIVVVHNWTEVNEPFLHAQREKLQGKSTEKAYFSYWRTQILEKQAEVRRGECRGAQIEATQFCERDLQQLAEWILRFSGPRHVFFYRGWLTDFRAFQLLSFLNSSWTLYLYDLWLPTSYKQLRRYAKDRKLLSKFHQVRFIIDWKEEAFVKEVQGQPGAPVLVDLTYYRNGLVRAPTLHRHSLKKDLIDLSQQVGAGTVIMGNCAGDSYVSEVLAQIEEEWGQEIIREGNCWYFEAEPHLEF